MIRVGDIVASRREGFLDDSDLRRREYLEQAIFDPTPLTNSIADRYIQSRPLVEKNSFPDELPKGTPRLGSFENSMLEKLLLPKRSVICVTGPMGCGKSTFVQYVLLHLIGSRRHCGHCPGQRLISHIDFNELGHLNDLPEAEISAEVLDILSDDLEAKTTLLDHSVCDRMQLSDFWRSEVEAFRTGKSTSKAFRALLPAIDVSGGIDLDASDLASHQIHQRKKLRDTALHSPELRFDYFVRLWRFYIEHLFKGRRGCAFVILDNVDRVAPAVQRVIMQVVTTNVRTDGPVFVLMLRDETLDYVGLSTTIIDIERHAGPTPWQVMRQRLQDFVTHPRAYYDAERSLSREDFDTLATFLTRLTDMLRGPGSRQDMRDFVETASGRSIRAAMLISQALCRLPKDVMIDERTALHDILRVVITRGRDQLNWQPNLPIEHLFRTGIPEPDSLLVKPRILTYLLNKPGHKGSLNEITNALLSFDYSPDLVVRAVDELLNPGHQLLRTNGLDAYYQPSIIIQHGGHNVVLTPMGRGYVTQLLLNIHYVQEAMLDSYVHPRRFPVHSGYQYLSDKLRILHRFLDEIRALDTAQSTAFVRRWGAEAYQSAFGASLLALTVIQGLYQPVCGILASYASRNSTARRECSSLQTDFRSLALQAEDDNNTILGLYPPSVVAPTEEPAG